jgi:chemotaxis protein MotB
VTALPDQRFPKRRRGILGQPAWLMTFADLMTLLLTFFILLLSFSEIDAEKYRAMIQSMAQAFGSQAVEARLPGGTPISLTESDRPPPASPALKPVPAATPQTWQAEAAAPEILPGLTSGTVPSSEVAPGIERLAAALIDQLEAEVANDRLAVSFDQRRVIVRFSEDATFPSGTANIKPRIKPIIDEIVTALAQCEGDIIVSGHSDDQPIVSSRYRSNWDLSAARAVSVVHQLVLDRRLDAERVMAAGHAETRPLVPNTSPENRARNRRVEISIYEPRCDSAINEETKPGEEEIISDAN